VAQRALPAARRRLLQSLCLPACLPLGAPLGLLLQAAPARVAARGAAESLRFDELYAGMSPQGLRYSARVQALRGQPVQMRGYAAPPLRADARFMVLTRQPMAICPFCSSDADWPADIVVVYCREPGLIPGGQALLASGRLDIGPQTDPDTGFVSQLRLRDAELVRN
jgi:hypothetical protein